MIVPTDPTPRGRGDAERLVAFRAGFHACWTRWPDAGFELSDALLCAPGPVSCLPALSLEPCFRRGHGSLYKALERGRVDADAMRDLLAASRPAGWPLVFAVDASTWARRDAETSPGRGFCHCAASRSPGKPVVPGWSYQWIAQLDWANDSWTAPLDATRIPPTADAATATADQIRALTARLGPTGQAPVFALDAGYDPIALTHDLAETRAVLTVRIRGDRVFHAAPPPPDTTAAGRPRRHGRRFCCARPDTWPDPDAELTADDRRYGTVRVRAWHDLHPKLGRRGHWSDAAELPIVAGTVVSVDVEHLPKPTSRAKKTLWLWVAAGAAAQPDLDVCWRAYLRRFDIEHTFRFLKNTLGWTTPAIRTPEQADTWTWTVAAAYTQLRLARGLVTDQRLPWERRLTPEHLTPHRVRRAFRRTAPTLGTPANPPKSHTPGPGRPKNTRTGPRTRYPVHKKAA